MGQRQCEVCGLSCGQCAGCGAGVTARVTTALYLEGSCYLAVSSEGPVHMLIRVMVDGIELSDRSQLGKAMAASGFPGDGPQFCMAAVGAIWRGTALETLSQDCFLLLIMIPGC